MTESNEVIDRLADWCERHLEIIRSREVGMTFSLLLRTYSKMASLKAEQGGGPPSDEFVEASSRAEALLKRLADEVIRRPVRWDKMPINPAKILGRRYNVMYDPGPRPKD